MLTSGPATSSKLNALLRDEGQSVCAALSPYLEWREFFALCATCRATRGWREWSGRGVQLQLHGLLSKVEFGTFAGSVRAVAKGDPSFHPKLTLARPRQIVCNPTAVSTHVNSAGLTVRETVPFGSGVDLANTSADVDLLDAATGKVVDQIVRGLQVAGRGGSVKFRATQLSVDYTPRRRFVFRVTFHVALLAQPGTTAYVAVSRPHDVVSNHSHLKTQNPVSATLLSLVSDPEVRALFGW